MNRMFNTEIIVDGTWNVEELKNHMYSYKLINMKTHDIYLLYNVIGFNQLTEDEFLIFRRSLGNYFEIRRLKLQNSISNVIYKHEFNNCYFINDDYILFTDYTNSGSYTFRGVYSIKQNEEVEEAEWLNLYNIDIYEDDETNECILCAEKQVYLNGDNCNLIFTVDPNTFNPIRCYSELRNQYFDIKSKEEFLAFKKEEEKYADIISNILREEKRNNKMKVKEKLVNEK